MRRIRRLFKNAKPATGTPLNTGHALSQGLKVCCVFNEITRFGGPAGTISPYVNYADASYVPKFFGGGGYIDCVSRPGGLGIQQGGGLGSPPQGLTFGTPPVNGLSNCSFMVRAYNMGVASGNPRRVLTCDIVFSETGIAFDAGQNLWYMYVTNQASAVKFATVASLGNSVSNQPYEDIVGTYDGANIKIYQNGVLKATTAQTGAILNTYTDLVMLASKASSATSLVFSDAISIAMVWNRTLGGGEVESLFINPYTMFYAPVNNLADIAGPIPPPPPIPSTPTTFVKTSTTGKTGKSGIKQTLIAVPEMHSFDDVRQVVAKSVNDLQLHISSQLPVQNQQGQRISNVGPPVAADDVVTLKYLQSALLPATQPVVTPASGVLIETNGTPNGVQSALNLVAGSNITLSASGGSVTITGAAGSGPSFSPPYIVNGTNSYGPAWALTAPPLTGWTWDNQGAATEDTAKGYPYLSLPTSGVTSIRFRYRTAPATPYSFTSLLTAAVNPANVGAENMYNYGFRNSANGKLVTIMIGISGSAYGALVTRWTNSTTFSANQYTKTGQTALSVFNMNQGLFIKIQNDGTNINFLISVDGGQHFLPTLYTETLAAFIGTADQIGYGGYVSSAGVDVALLSFLQGV